MWVNGYKNIYESIYFKVNIIQECIVNHDKLMINHNQNNNNNNKSWR